MFGKIGILAVELLCVNVKTFAFFSGHKKLFVALEGMGRTWGSCQSADANFGFTAKLAESQAIRIPLIVRQMSHGSNIDESALEHKYWSN